MATQAAPARSRFFLISGWGMVALALVSFPFTYFFSGYNFVDIGLFTLMSSLALFAASRHPDWHRRFMLGAAVALFVAAASRLMLVLPPVPPWTDLGSAVIGDAVLVWLALHDRRQTGRVHPATWLLLAVMVPVHLSSPLLSKSALLTQHLGPALVDMMKIAPPD